MRKWTSSLGFEQDLPQLGHKLWSITRNHGQEALQAEGFINEQELVPTFSSLLRAGAGQLGAG